MIIIGFLALAALGSVARVVISHHLNKQGFPYGTLTVNVAGSFLLGLLASSSSDSILVFGTGALGAMTTFSTLSQEAVNLTQSRKLLKAGFYISITLTAGVLAAWLGLIVSS